MILFPMILLGAFLSRWHGGGYFNAPKAVKNAAWATIPSVLVFFAYYDAQMPFLACASTLVCFPLCLAGIATGHGQYFSLGKVIKPIKPEKLDFIVSLFFGRDPRTKNVLNFLREVESYGMNKLMRRCTFGLSVTGFASVSGFVLMMLPIDPYAAIMVLIMGLMKPWGYHVGYALDMERPNVLGELLFGAFVYAALGVTI